MTQDELNEKMLVFLESLSKEDELPPFDPAALADVLLDELEENWDTLPDKTRSIMIGVAALLNKHYADELISEIIIDDFLRKIRDL
ncbi:hypothetical protein [Nitrosomonas sp. Nm34]|uniref:hypothetical protein n=1 Tax=Nitrosomonas sp. Nm34 TaxID=1881055 RepID=UPI0008EF1392|nr:hypothetical protein [Nitrosomonas sp. Nm34]SFI31135.1 hypothetical protein SAMN05428978_100551 [Nitrosomonas sp. Nm34]